MREIITAIEIAAPAERVWRILTDFASYPAWNPFIPEIRGEPTVGERLAVCIRPAGRKGTTFWPTLLNVVPQRELRWRGRVFVPGIFDGEHAFALEPLGARRVRFVQREAFRGLLVPLVWRWMAAPTRHGFGAMNRALKARAEA